MRQVAWFVFSVHLLLSFQCWTPALEWQFAACLIVSGVQMKDHFGKLSNLAGSPQWLSSFRTVNSWPCKNTHTQITINHESTGDCSPPQSKIKLCFIFFYIPFYPQSILEFLPIPMGIIRWGHHLLAHLMMDLIPVHDGNSAECGRPDAGTGSRSKFTRG